MTRYGAFPLLLLLSALLSSGPVIANPSLDPPKACLNWSVSRPYSAADKPDTEMNTTMPQNAAAWGNVHLKEVNWPDSEKTYRGDSVSAGSPPVEFSEVSGEGNWQFNPDDGVTTRFGIGFYATFRSSSAVASRVAQFVLGFQPLAFGTGVSGLQIHSHTWTIQESVIRAVSVDTVMDIQDGDHVGLFTRNSMTDPAGSDAAVTHHINSIGITFTQLSTPEKPCR